MTAATFRAVDALSGKVSCAGCVASRPEIERLTDELAGMRERAEIAERGLTRFQEQSVRIQELEAEALWMTEGLS